MYNAVRMYQEQRPLRLAAASPRVVPGDVRANTEAVIQCIRQADAARADYLALPALCLTGATLGALYTYDALLKAASGALEAICCAVRNTKVTVSVGLPYRIDGEVLSCAAILRSDRVYAILPLSQCEAPFGFSPFLCGNTAMPLTPIPRLRAVGDVIFSAMDASPGDVILSQSSANATASSYRKTLETLRLCSARTGAAIAYAAPNPGESGTSFIFDGCCAIAAGGEILASACMEAEPFVCADVDAGTLAPFEPFFRPAAQTSYLPEDETLARADCERILDLQAAALARRAAHIGSKGFVIGVSGGLDSALALLAAVAAAEKLHMPASEVVGISMPGFGSSRRTRGNAKALVEALGCTYREIDITASCRQHFQDIGQDENDHNVVFENAQARERTQILLDISNKEGLLDVGTGDLSEAALGWTTFGGDHLAQYGVNASIPKTVMRRVVAVAKERFAQAAPVLQDILDTPVSPELLPGQNGEIAQKTEELIGSYTLHDLFIYEMVVNHKSPKALYEAALEKTDFPEAEVYRVLGIFLKRFFAQQFKRVCAPEAPLILLSIAPSCFPFPSDMRAGVFWEEYESIKNG